MALVIDLKPQEKILIGEAVITNSTQRTRLHIAGDAPIIREKDIMQEEEANTPCKRVYFLIQCMYISRNSQDYYEPYFSAVRDIQTAAPSFASHFMKINIQIINGAYYKAMKLTKALIEEEKELLGNATAAE
ncbi:MAG: flagellar biosynthesis repressor FlbT [Alphaproteobacteria bacterium]